MTELLRAALSYAARGWPCVPLHAPADTPHGCTCGNPAKCSPGKHPCTAHGLRDASTDAKVIRRWFEVQWPAGNLALVTGELFAVVLDVDAGKGGEESLLRLVRRYGKLPETVEALTGGGGRHLCFRHPGVRVPNRQNWAHYPGLDVRGDGGYICAPPSRHVSGRRYEWEASSHPDDVPLADLPDGLVELLTVGSRPRAAWQPQAEDVLHAPLPVLSGCWFLDFWGRARNQAHAPEAVWYAQATIYARLQGGREAFHAMSRAYPRYSPEETDAKLLHAARDTGPRTCREIRGTLGAEDLCGQCPFWGRVTTPLGIAETREAHLVPPPEQGNWRPGAGL